MFSLLLFAQSNAQTDVSSVKNYALQIATLNINFYKVAPGTDGQGAVVQSTAKDSTGQQWYRT